MKSSLLAALGRRLLFLGLRGSGSGTLGSLTNTLSSLLSTSLTRGGDLGPSQSSNTLEVVTVSSNTISNMMFSLFQFEVGIRIGVDATWMVALQAVGGAAGNVVCVHNVVAASAVVGLPGREGDVIRKTFIVFFYYALSAGLIGFAFLKLGLFSSVG